MPLYETEHQTLSSETLPAWNGFDLSNILWFFNLKKFPNTVDNLEKSSETWFIISSANFSKPRFFHQFRKSSTVQLRNFSHSKIGTLLTKYGTELFLSFGKNKKIAQVTTFLSTSRSTHRFKAKWNNKSTDLQQFRQPHWQFKKINTKLRR